MYGYFNNNFYINNMKQLLLNTQSGALYYKNECAGDTTLIDVKLATNNEIDIGGVQWIVEARIFIDKKYSFSNTKKYLESIPIDKVTIVLEAHANVDERNIRMELGKRHVTAKTIIESGENGEGYLLFENNILHN